MVGRLSFAALVGVGSVWRIAMGGCVASVVKGGSLAMLIFKNLLAICVRNFLRIFNDF